MLVLLDDVMKEGDLAFCENKPEEEEDRLERKEFRSESVISSSEHRPLEEKSLLLPEESDAISPSATTDSCPAACSIPMAASDKILESSR